LRRSSYVLIRDPISYSIVTHYAKHVGSIKSIIKLGYDYAFNCVGKATRRAEKKIENLRNIAEVNEGKKIVFLNLMPHISKRIALSIVRQIVELGYCVLLYPHELDDFLWTRDLCSETNGLNGEIRSKTFVFDTMPYSSSELYYVLSRLNLHGDVALGVSCRSHGAIAFLTNLIPTAHLAYSHKGVGIMKMVGLGDYCTQTQQPNGHTLRTLISLLDKKSEEYRSFLRREIPIIRHRIMTQTRDAIDLVTQGA
jgi:polysaccharide pyruvyl transferase WcaK-like protein